MRRESSLFSPSACSNTSWLCATDLVAEPPAPMHHTPIRSVPPPMTQCPFFETLAIYSKQADTAYRLVAGWIARIMSKQCRCCRKQCICKDGSGVAVGIMNAIADCSIVADLGNPPLDVPGAAVPEGMLTSSLSRGVSCWKASLLQAPSQHKAAVFGMQTTEGPCTYTTPDNESWDPHVNISLASFCSFWAPVDSLEVHC